MDAADVAGADDLYRLEPAEFVAARNALVRRLRAKRRRDEARAVAALRRPTVPAWALNQVAREEPELVDRALDAGARLRDATQAAVEGDAGELRAATMEDRAAGDAVVAAALARVGGAGGAVRQQITSTLRAAVLDEEVAGQLRRGVLAADHDASGFGFAAQFDLGTLRSKPTGKAPARSTAGSEGDGDDDAAAEAERARREAEARERAEQRRRELEERVRRLEDRVAQLTAEADDAESVARAARAEADAAAEELELARRALDGD